MSTKFTVSDGRLILVLEPAGKGWYCVTSPFDPGITTQAKTVEGAFLMAYDAQKALRASRAKLAREFGREMPPATPRKRPAVPAADLPTAASPEPVGASTAPPRRTGRHRAIDTRE